MAHPAVADDGEKVLKSTSKEGGAVEGPVPESEHAFTGMMKFYVPLQGADGAVLTAGVDYTNVDGVVEDTRTLGKPLINVFHKGPVERVDGTGFIGHGKRDAFASVSLDDGLTWKSTNLSESAGESSSDVIRTDIPLFADTEGAYPGDVVNIFHALAGNKVLVAWPSRFCDSGEPSYSLDSDENAARREAIAAYLGIDLATASADDLYLLDMYGVSGNQGSVDYSGDKFEQNQAVGEVPFNCLWTARGELIKGDDPRTETVEATFMRWFNTERLTSGARDVNRIEAMGVAGAGFAITWQEDPEGLRGGQGEGPGEGWSGAVANSQTDVWYSHIDFEDFNVVQDPADETGGTAMTLADYELAALDTEVTQKPKPFVPFAMPMRLTDNAKCNVTNPQPYCYGDALRGTVDVPADDQGIVLDPALYGLKDNCATTVEIPTGQNNTPTPICVTAAGLPMVGNTAATRPRLNLYGYETDGDLTDAATAAYDSAFVVVQLEEDKGLGRFGYTEEGAPCDPDTVDGCVAFDEGKNQWYHSFSMSLTDPMVAEDDGLLANLSDHGNMLNQPEVDWETGEFYDAQDTETMWDFGDDNYEIYNTEIARRGSLLGQDVYKAAAATQRLLLLPTWKQGVMNQGGPADVMSRRIVLPDGWTLAADGNPYAFRNMECASDNWLFEAGDNPYYPDGLCGASALNLSGAIPDTAVDSDGGAALTPPQVTFGTSTFGIGDTDPILQGGDVVPNTAKVLTWHQCPATFTSLPGDVDTVTCDEDTRTDDTTLADQSWYNPLDVAKGHRGYIDGDFVMMLYGWSPNWRLNAKGSDRYELYIRRSFTGATSWGTQPASGTHWDGTAYAGDGTVTCEIYRDDTTDASGELDEPRACNEYAAGADEQARNVTQHKSMRITTLDPRAAMTGAPQGVSITADPFGYGIPNYTSGTGDSEDVRDPSRYFIAYETGDNTTTDLGEPEPLDLFYSRAAGFGDDYQVWAEDVEECYPSVPHDQVVDEVVEGSGFCNEFDQLEQGTPGLEASEASLTANPGGEFLYATWAQMLHEEVPADDLSTASSPAESNEPTWDVTYVLNEPQSELAEADAMARRVWWIDGYVSDTLGWDFGQGAGDNPVPLSGRLAAEAAEAAAAAEGVASVELWVDTPAAGEEFVKVDEDIATVDGVFAFTATEGGGTYRFYTIAVADDGTREEAPEGADTETLYLAEGADLTAPVSEASAKRVSNGKPFMVRYQAADEVGGTGLARVDLYARVPGAKKYELVDTDSGEAINRRFLYRPTAGDGVYLFYTVATDKAGNVEAAPDKADARTRVDGTPPRATPPQVTPRPFDIGRDRVMKVKSWLSEKGRVTVQIKRNGRVVRSYTTKASAGKFVQTWNGRFKAGRLVPNRRYTVVLRVVDLAGNTIVKRTRVRVAR